MEREGYYLEYDNNCRSNTDIYDKCKNYFIGNDMYPCNKFETVKFMTKMNEKCNVFNTLLNRDAVSKYQLPLDRYSDLSQCRY